MPNHSILRPRVIRVKSADRHGLREGVDIPDVYWNDVCRVAAELDVAVPAV